jgi:prepilin-type N-terminal cleavage/methylation domain-containing protein
MIFVLDRPLRISRSMFDTRTTPRTRHHAADGFSLIEMMLVVAVGIILAAMAIPVSSNFISTSKADASTVATVDALTTARDRSVAERRNFEVAFAGTNHIQVRRDEVPSGLQTLISDTQLENGQQFQKFAALPDTPDGFGNTTAIYFSGPGPWMFTSDGSLIDSNGDVSNGTVLLGVPNQTMTARAVTIYGATGLIRAWNWRGNKWFN